MRTSLQHWMETATVVTIVGAALLAVYLVLGAGQMLFHALARKLWRS